MKAILDIADRVSARVNSLHAEVLTRALDTLENRLTVAEFYATQVCSYGAVLDNYTALKISLHHLNRNYHDSEGETAVDLHRRIADFERRLRALRHGMYSNVCLDCDACRSRRKAWPDHAVVKTVKVPLTARFDTKRIGDHAMRVLRRAL